MSASLSLSPSWAVAPALLALAPAAAANVVPCGPSVPPGVVCLNNNVSDTMGGGPLEAGKVYHLSGNVTVPAGQTLTVESGAIVKFHPNAGLDVRGVLSSGAAFFTSLADDTLGGDTNGDGPSAGMPGDWGGLSFFFAASSASVVDGAEIRFGTNGIYHFGTTADAANVTHQQIKVRWCSAVGFSTGIFSRPTLSGASLEDNRLAAQANLRALPGFVGNSASGNAQGDCIEIVDGTVSGNVTIGPPNTLDGRPFAVCSSILVEAGATLDLQPGVVLKFGPILGVGGTGCTQGNVTVQGTLLADGVVLTALEDDTIGGDLDKGGPSLGTPGDWGRLTFLGSSTSLLRNTLLRFGGATTLVPFAGPAIDLVASDVVLDGVGVAECSGQGLRLNAGVNASFPIVSDCSFTANLGAAVERVPVAAVAGFADNSAAGNLLDTMEVAGGTLDGFAGIEKQHSLNADGAFLMGGTLTVNAGAELALGAGVVLKWPTTTAVLAVNGTLTASGTAAERVVLTSRPDDALVGDSNKDGGATQPAPGDWVGIDFRAGSDASVLDGVTLRFAGRATQANAAIELSADPTIRNTLVERSQTGALDLNVVARPTVSGGVFQDNLGLAVASAAVGALPGFTGCSATNNGLGDYIEVVDGDVSSTEAAGCALEFGPANALAPDRVFVVDDDVDVPPGCQLSLLGGTIIKWKGSRELDVDGTLQVGSVGGGTTVFTSLADDSVAGDTAKDGFSQGTPGDWQGLDLSGPGSVIQDALVRFAGAVDQRGVSLVNADAQLDDLRVEDCLGSGLHLNSSSLPLVDGCSFERNDLAVNGVPLRALPGFSNCSAQDNKVGDYQRITQGTVATDLLVRPSQALNGGVFVLASDVSLLPGATLTIDPGVTFKAEGNRLVDLDGTLVTGAPVVFTTLTDDINGDTNEDLGTTAPVPGSWRGLVFRDDSGGSVLAGLRVRYAGFATVGGGPSVELDRADVSLTGARIEHSAGAGLLLRNGARPLVCDSVFADNQGLPVNGVSLGAVQGFADNTASGNAPGDYLRVNDATIGGQATLARRSSLNGNGVFVIATDIGVSAPDTLTLRPGTILKFEGVGRDLVSLTGTVNVEGTGLEPVVLTSIHDDAVGGDTRKDGSASTPAPGDWGRFEAGFGAGAGRVEHLHARYGGSGAFAAIELENDLASARSIRADFSSVDGIRGHRHAGEAVNWVAFGCLGDGIELAGGSYDLVHATAAGNGGAGIRKVLGHVGSLWSSISHDNGSEVVGFAPGQVLFSNVGPAFAGSDGNLDADPAFVDPVGGDLRLAAGSPCIDAADVSAALGVTEDHVEASRILDDGFDGSVAPDMGAFERAAYTLSASTTAFGGEPRIGSLLSVTAHGEPGGLALFRVGPLDGTTFEGPLGFTLYGTSASGIVLGHRPTGKPLTIPVAALGPPGTEFGVQALVRAFAGPLRGLSGPVPATAASSSALGPLPEPGAEALRSAATPGAARVGHHTNLYRGLVTQ